MKELKKPLIFITLMLFVSSSLGVIGLHNEIIPMTGTWVFGIAANVVSCAVAMICTFMVIVMLPANTLTDDERQKLIDSTMVNYEYQRQLRYITTKVAARLNSIPSNAWNPYGDDREFIKMYTGGNTELTFNYYYLDHEGNVAINWINKGKRMEYNSLLNSTPKKVLTKLDTKLYTVLNS